MYLKSENIIINVDGVRFTSFQTALPQFVLDPIALTGWYDGVDIRRDITVRPTSWGDFSEGGRMAARAIAVSGTAIAKTSRQLGEMRDQFTSILSDGNYKEMSLQDASGTRYAEVGLEGAPVWLRQSDTVASWRIALYAPDPRILGGVQRVNIGEGGGDEGLEYPLRYPLNYDTSVDSKPKKVITNDGNVEAWPEFKVTGNFAKGFTITNGKDREVSYSGMVTNQAPVVIDMAKGTAIQNGVDKTILMRKREWFPIPPGGSIRPVFKATMAGTGWCDIIFRDTWI